MKKEAIDSKKRKEEHTGVFERERMEEKNHIIMISKNKRKIIEM